MKFLHISTSTRPKNLCGTLLLCVSALIITVAPSIYADESQTAAVTNIHLVSDSYESKAWTRQAVLATPSNTIMDLSGVFVATAEAVAQSNEAERVATISDAAIEGMRSAFLALYAVTGNVPDNAYHVAMAIPPQESPRSLMGYVVKEETDGITDTQWVWYSERLAAAPVRHVEYTTPAGTFSQSAKWIAWNADGENITINGRTWKGCHKCTIPRPESAKNIPALSRRNEIFGGENGFDFGAAIVTVGGKGAFTGEVTNDLTGVVLRFDNGILKKGNE